MAVWPYWAIYWTLGNFLKPMATISLPKSPTFLGNFWKVWQFIIFLVKSFLANFYTHLAIFSGHTDNGPKVDVINDVLEEIEITIKIEKFCSEALTFVKLQSNAILQQKIFTSCWWLLKWPISVVLSVQFYRVFFNGPSPASFSLIKSFQYTVDSIQMLNINNFFVND